MACESCGDKPKKCNKDFTKAVIEIDNPEQITLMRKVTIPASMGDDTTVPPVVGKYHNVLLYYEANSKTYLYSSDGIPTQLVNGVTDYEAAVNLPQINGHTLLGNKTGDQLGLQNKLTAGENISIDSDNVISAVDTTYGPATDTEIGLVKPGDGLEVDANGTMSISNIEQYAHFFDTVADMKAATNLVAGDYAKTLGYYALNDIGGAYYKISSAAPSGYYETLTSGLYAELVIEDTMNVKQFGAKGDGIVDDTAKIQNAFDACNNIIIPSGTYMIDASTTLVPNDNSKIALDNDATLKAITNDLETYRIIHVINKSNVEISGGTLEGDRATHTGATGEWGTGIRVYGNSTNVYIHDILIKDTWGDGITVATTGNVKTEHVHIDNARRNGYSIISVNEFISNDDIIENTGGTNPQAGVDIEPDTASNILTNVVFNNLMTKNNLGGGLSIYLMAFDNTSTATNIVVNNLYDYGSKYGIKVTKNTYTKGLISFDKPYLESSKDSGICLWGCYDSDLALKINKPYILNCDTSGKGALYGAGISGYVLEADSIAEPIGNIEIVEPYITSAYESQTTAIGLRSYKNDLDVKVNNVKIINPINLGGDQIYIEKPTNLYFSDKYNVTKFSTNSSYTIPGSEYYSLYSNREATTATRTLTIPDTITTIGRKLRFRNMNPTYALFIKLPTTDYCHQLSNNLSPTITLAKIGDTIELERLTATEWIISSINYTPTVS